MNLVLDIGNTFAKFYAFDGDRPVGVMKSEGGDLVGLSGFVDKWRPCVGILSTVCDLSKRARQELALLPCRLTELTPATPLPIENDYTTPSTLGSDRIATIVGAWSLEPGRDILVIDAGTCITYDLIRSDSHYIGGNITPGIDMRLRAMHHFTSRLPLVVPDGDTPPFGYNTETALRSGAVRGAAMEAQSIIAYVRGAMPDSLVYLTGGGAARLKEYITVPCLTDDLLTARGLNHILRHNTPAAARSAQPSSTHASTSL